MGQEPVSEVATKLYVAKNALVLGVSGPVGLAQRFYSHLDRLPNSEFTDLGNKPI